VFSLTPNATVDEGNNWVNVSWGPLALSDDSVTGGANGNYGGGNLLGNYGLTAGSQAVDYVPVNSSNLPTAADPTLITDFYGNPRPDPNNPNGFDIGAVELQPSAPVVTSISPNSGARGYSVAVTFTGSGFWGGSGGQNLPQVTLNAPAGITALNGVINVTSDTTATATLNIAQSVAVGPYQIGLIVGSTKTTTAAFNVVNPPAPTITSITPNISTRVTVSVTIKGTNLLTLLPQSQTPPGLSVTGSQIKVTVNSVSDTTITATFQIFTAEPYGQQTVFVRTLGGTATIPFTVVQPILNSITPNNGNVATSVPVTLSGQYLTGATGLAGLTGGITVSNFHAVNDSTVTATLNISATATGGARTVSVVVPGGNSTTQTFTVNNPQPATITSISPTSGVRGTTIPVTLTGTNFMPGNTINTGSNIGVGPMTINSAGTQITTTFTIGNTAATGARNITVTNSTNTPSNAVSFTVTAGTPSWTIGAMTSNPAGSATKTGTVTLRNSATGSSAGPLTLTATPTIAGTGGGGTWSITGGTCANGLVLNAGSTCTINVQYTYPTGSAAGSPTAQVTISDTGSSTGTTTQNSPNISAAGPVLASISPTSGYRGLTVPVTLSGYGLTGTTAISAGGGISATNITVVNDNSVTAKFVIGTSASTTAHNVTVTAPGGTSGAVAFTVSNPPPATITSISPASGVRGSTIPITITGTNLTAGSSINAGSNIGIGSLTISPDGTQITTTFSIVNMATVGPRNVTVTNTSGTASAPATFTVTAGTASFTVPPATGAGSMVTSPGTLTTKNGVVTVTNSASGSNAGPLTFTAAPTINKTGGPGTFSIVSGGTCTSSTVLAPGSSCTINVQYAPGTSTALSSAQVTITDTGNSGTGTTQNSPVFQAN
jgi:hypothetical protein